MGAVSAVDVRANIYLQIVRHRYRFKLGAVGAEARSRTDFTYCVKRYHALPEISASESC